jgi:hypothetical protein
MMGVLFLLFLLGAVPALLSVPVITGPLLRVTVKG